MCISCRSRQALSFFHLFSSSQPEVIVTVQFISFRFSRVPFSTTILTFAAAWLEQSLCSILCAAVRFFLHSGQLVCSEVRESTSAVSSHAEERLRRCLAAVRSLGEGVASFQTLPWQSGNGKGSRDSNYTLPSACIRWRRRSSLVVSVFRCHRRCIILRFFLTPSWHVLFIISDFEETFLNFREPFSEHLNTFIFVVKSQEIWEETRTCWPSFRTKWYFL